MTFPYLFTFLTACSLTVIITPLVKRLAVYLKVVDEPGPRKIHTKAVPLLGGLAIFISMVIVSILLWLLGHLNDGRFSMQLLAAAGIAGLLLMIGGYLDDRYRLAPWYQIIFPMLAAAIMVGAGLSVRFITNPLGGIITIPLFWGSVIAWGWLMVVMYTTKLLDGVDGLLTGVSTIGSFFIFLVSLHWDVPLSATSFLAIAFAGALAGFLFFNWNPARIFLGEGGSVLCGFVLGVLSIISGSKIATALLIMGLPMIDLFLVVFQRVLQGSAITSGDGRHLHFKLLAKGLSQRQTVLLLYAITAIFGVVALISSTQGKILALGVLCVLVGVLVWYTYKGDRNEA